MGDQKPSLDGSEIDWPTESDASIIISKLADIFRRATNGEPTLQKSKLPVLLQSLSLQSRSGQDLDSLDDLDTVAATSNSEELQFADFVLRLLEFDGFSFELNEQLKTEILAQLNRTTASAAPQMEIEPGVGSAKEWSTRAQLLLSSGQGQDQVFEANFQQDDTPVHSLSTCEQEAAEEATAAEKAPEEVVVAGTEIVSEVAAEAASETADHVTESQTDQLKAIASKAQEAEDSPDSDSEDEMFASMMPMTANREKSSSVTTLPEASPGGSTFSFNPSAKPFSFNPGAASWTPTAAPAKVPSYDASNDGGFEYDENAFEDDWQEQYQDLGDEAIHDGYDDGWMNDGVLNEDGLSEGFNEDGSASYGGSSHGGSAYSTPYMSGGFYGGTRSATTSPYLHTQFLGGDFEEHDVDFGGHFRNSRRKEPMRLDNKTRMAYEQDLAEADKVRKKKPDTKAFDISFLLAFKDRPELRDKTEELKQLNLNIVRGHEDGQVLTTIGAKPVKGGKKSPGAASSDKKKKKGPGGGVGGTPVGCKAHHPNSFFRDHPDAPHGARSVGSSPAGPGSKKMRRVNSRDSNHRGISRSSSRDFSLNDGPVEPLQASENAWKKVVPVSEAEDVAARRKLLALLNKLTPEMWDKLMPQFEAVRVSSKVTMEAMVDSIFSKAVTESAFASMYAELCLELSNRVGEVAGPEGQPVSFNMLLLERCGKAMAEAAEEEEDSEEEEEDHQLREAIAMKMLLGTMTFIGELFKKKLVVTESLIVFCLDGLLEPEEPEEEDEEQPGGDEIPEARYIEAACRLLTVIGSEMEKQSQSRTELDKYFETAEKLASDQRLPSRIRFMLKDLIDLRKDKWRPRIQAVVDPKALDAVKQDAEDAARRGTGSALKIQRSQSDWHNVGRNPSRGGRNSPHNRSANNSPFQSPQQSPSFSPSFRGGNHRGDSKPLGGRFQLQGSGNQDVRRMGSQPLVRSVSDGVYSSSSSKTGSARKGTRPPLPPGTSPVISRTSSSGPGLRGESSPPGSPGQEKNEDFEKQVKKQKAKAEGWVKEYLTSGDLEDVVYSLQKVNDDSFHKHFVFLVLEMALEGKVADRAKYGDILSGLASTLTKILTEVQLQEGFSMMLRSLDGLMMDCPMANKIVGQLLGRCAIVGTLSLGVLHPLSNDNDESYTGFLAGRSGKGLVISALETVRFGLRPPAGDAQGLSEEQVKDLWTQAGLQPQDWLPEGDANSEGANTAFSAAKLDFLS